MRIADWKAVKKESATRGKQFYTPKTFRRKGAEKQEETNKNTILTTATQSFIC